MRVSVALAKALRITVVSDREGDSYEDFALKPGNVQVLIRASANRIALKWGDYRTKELTEVNSVGSKTIGE